MNQSIKQTKVAGFNWPPENWVSNCLFQTLLSSNPVWHKPQLVKLPAEYYNVSERYRQAKCSACNTVPAYATLCLLCGTYGHLEETSEKCWGMSSDLKANRVNSFLAFWFLILKLSSHYFILIYGLIDQI